MWNTPRVRLLTLRGVRISFDLFGSGLPGEISDVALIVLLVVQSVDHPFESLGVCNESRKGERGVRGFCGWLESYKTAKGGKSRTTKGSSMRISAEVTLFRVS